MKFTVLAWLYVGDVSAGHGYFIIPFWQIRASSLSQKINWPQELNIEHISQASCKWFLS